MLSDRSIGDAILKKRLKNPGSILHCEMAGGIRRAGPPVFAKE